MILINDMEKLTIGKKYLYKIDIFRGKNSYLQFLGVSGNRGISLLKHKEGALRFKNLKNGEEFLFLSDTFYEFESEEEYLKAIAMEELIS